MTSRLVTLKRAYCTFAPYRARIIVACAFVLVSAIIAASYPLYAQRVIDVYIPQQQLSSVAAIMAVFLLAMTVRMACWFISQILLLRVEQHAIFALRSSVFVRIQQLCLRFHDRYPAGFLYDRTLGNASTAVGHLLTTFTNVMVSNSVIFIGSIIFCLTLSPMMTLWVVIASILFVLASNHYGKVIQKQTEQFNLAISEFAGKVTDLFRGVRTIKAFALEDRVAADFSRDLWPLQSRWISLSLETLKLSFVSEALSYLIYAAVILTGSMLVINHRLTLGQLVAFVAYQAQIVSMMSSLTGTVPAIASALAGIDQMHQVLDAQSTVIEHNTAKLPSVLTGEIRFDSVRFAYKDRTVIDDISLTIAPGQSVALVGRSGSGKTTLLSLLLRFYDCDHGAIRLDGIDIREFPTRDYRSLFGVVLQDPFLFNDSIYNNLRSIKPDATDDQLRHALEMAFATEFVGQLEGGWRFKVGEGGARLSGGQKQRIAIARCLLLQPRIALLDEATSALDTQSELHIQHAIEQLLVGRNVFIIAHRLSTIRRVDRVIVLDQGKIAQDGTFDNLKTTPGIFRDLYQASAFAS